MLNEVCFHMHPNYPTNKCGDGVPAAEIWGIKEIHGVNHKILWIEGKNWSENDRFLPDFLFVSIKYKLRRK